MDLDRSLKDLDSPIRLIHLVPLTFIDMFHHLSLK